MTVTKRCTKCRKAKPASEFGRSKRSLDGLRSWCKTCHAMESREWREKNPAKARELTRTWQKLHPDKVRTALRKYAAKTRSTPKGKLSFNVRRLMWRSLKGTKAGRKWENLAGYTVDQLKNHLEKLFGPEMTWENYGTVWEIDHKIPTAAFNFERPEDPDFKRCWDLKNLRPLEVRRNRMKSDKTDLPFQPSLTI